MTDPNVTPFLQTLLDNARLGSPITFDGAAMTAASVIPPAVEYDAHGWGLTASEIGGRHSKGVDALIAELTAASCNPAIIAEVSTQHIARTWGAPEVYGFAVRDDRFNTPNPATVPPLTADQIYQIEHNLTRLNNVMFANALGGAPGAATAYRGQVGHAGYTHIDLSLYASQGWQENGLSPLDVAAQFVPPPIKFPAAKGIVGLYMWGKVDPTKHYPDHNVVNIFTDCRDDTAITRMWRSWVIAVGAQIPA